MTWIWVAAYLLFSLAGWMGYVYFTIQPMYSETYKTNGSDVSVCAAVGLGALALIPPAALVGIVLGVQMLWSGWCKGRPLPKCPVLIKGRRAA